MEMKDQFCSYEISLALRELGFDRKCLARYPSVTSDYAIRNDLNPNNTLLIGSYGKNDLPAPLWQQAIDWFREKYDLILYIKPKGPMIPNGIGWNAKIKILDQLVDIYDSFKEGWYDESYYNAREQAILKAIELIK